MYFHLLNYTIICTATLLFSKICMPFTMSLSTCMPFTIRLSTNFFLVEYCLLCEMILACFRSFFGVITRVCFVTMIDSVNTFHKYVLLRNVSVYIFFVESFDFLVWFFKEITTTRCPTISSVARERCYSPSPHWPVDQNAE